MAHYLFRFIRYFWSKAVLVAYVWWAMDVGLSATGVLTPAIGWGLVGSAVIVFLLIVWRLPKSIRAFTGENKEIAARQPLITKLRRTLSDLEIQIDIVRSTVEAVPLSYYDTNYLSKFDGYQEFKQKYITENGATENDAQYVALGVHYGMNDNPLFSDTLKGSPSQVSLDRIGDLEQELPDPCLHTLVELLIEVKKRQSISAIDHKLNPSRWNAYVSDIRRRDDVEYELSGALRKVKREIDRRLAKLANGAKYG